MDVLCDDLGAWKQSETRGKCYEVHKDKSGLVLKVSRCNEKTKGRVTVTRRPFKNQSDPTLHKVLVNVTNHDMSNHNIVLLHYYFDGPPHEIEVKPHLNAKINVPYLRTFQSTKEILQETLAQSGSVSKKLFQVTKGAGGVEDGECGGALPRGKDQAAYIKRKLKQMNDDPIFDINQAIRNYEHNSAERFIRSYSNDDGSPKVIAFTDKQIDDLANFCCNSRAEFKSLLFADITFQLGPFYLLLTAYANTTLFTKGTENCPVMIGPLMLCMLKDKQTYLTLFQKLSNFLPGLRLYL